MTAGGGNRPANRDGIVVAALLATYMQAVNISLPSAAALHMQGGLSMANDQVGWVFSSYIAASIVTAPMAGWLAGRFGRKAVYQSCIAAFAIGLVLDTLATTTGQFVLARIIQGAASGPLAPLSLAILLDVLPPIRHPRINLIWTVTAVLGISTGGSIGGWLSDEHGWRSIFYFSLPMAGFIFLAMALSLPERKAQEIAAFDFFGFATFALGIIGLQMMLDRGERLEWFASPEIWVEAAASAFGFYAFIVHVLTARAHFLDKALLKDRNFILTAVMFFAFGFVLLPTLALTSPMLEEMLHYPVDTTGYMTLPRGITLVGALVATSLLPARTDPRLFVAGGMALVIYANWRMLGYSPAMDWRPVAATGLLQGAGLGILMPTLGRVAFGTLDPKNRREGSALLNLSRLYGSTIGIAVVQIFFHGNLQAMHGALARNLTPYRAAAPVGPPSAATLAALNEMVTGQAAMVAVVGQFKILMMAMLIVSPLVLFLRKSESAN